MNSMARAKVWRVSQVSLRLVLLIGWIATLAIVMRAGGEAPAAFIPFPSAALIENLPQCIRVFRHCLLLLFQVFPLQVRQI